MSTTVNAGTVPNTTAETETLNQSEKEYDRMISQQMILHKTMMDDIMRMSTGTNSTYTYPLSSGGMWAAENINEYTCANALGHRADLGGYCIFDDENNAKNACSSDPTCLGYVSNTPNFYQLTRNPVANDVANGNFYKKIINTTNDTPEERMNSVAGLGNTIASISASNASLFQRAKQFSNNGSQNVMTASNLDTEIKDINASMKDSVKEYEALMNQIQAQKEGFSNPSMDGALEISAIMSESEKYALILFGVCAIFLFYKTMKYL